MPVHVLVPVDGSSQSFAGLVYTLVSFPEASVTVLHVLDPVSGGYPVSRLDDDPDATPQQLGEEILEEASEIAAVYDRDFETAIESGRPHTVVLEQIAESDVDHVVLGSHGGSPVAGPFLGHVSEAVVQRSPVSTTVVPETRADVLQRSFPGRILVPVDGSEQSLAALEYAIDRFPAGRFTILHAVSQPFASEDGPDGGVLDALNDRLTARGESILDRAKRSVGADDVLVETALERGEPARAIVEYAAAHGFDQIVMGSHGRSLPARIVLGSVAETVARRSPVAVTLVRGRPDGG